MALHHGARCLRGGSGWDGGGEVGCGEGGGALTLGE